MILFPAIDLKDGQCVRLLRGDMAQATVFNDDPAAQAAAFIAAGAAWLHIVDLNGAFAGEPINGAAVRGILAAAGTAGAQVQLGGGIVGHVGGQGVTVRCDACVELGEAMTLGAPAVGHSPGGAQVVFPSKTVAAGPAAQQVLGLDTNTLTNLQSRNAVPKTNEINSNWIVMPRPKIILGRLSAIRAKSNAKSPAPYALPVCGIGSFLSDSTSRCRLACFREPC